MRGMQLLVISGPERGRVVPLECEELHLGRAASSGAEAPGWIFFHENTVSRLHAVLRWDHQVGAYVLHHRSDTNVTLMNGQPVTSHPVKPGDQFSMGAVTVEMQKVIGAADQLYDRVMGQFKSKTST